MTRRVLARFLDPEPLPGWPKYRPEALFKSRVELFLARALYALLRIRFYPDPDNGTAPGEVRS